LHIIGLETGDFKMTLNNKIMLTQMADEAIEELSQATGADEAFLCSARVEILRKLKATQPELLIQTKESFVKKASFHAKTLELLHHTMKHLKTLTEKEQLQNKLSVPIPGQLSSTKVMIINTFLKNCGGFGPSNKIQA
jgi:hypothetical protein